jgi:branched-chain amino acid transport system permease protein
MQPFVQVILDSISRGSLIALTTLGVVLIFGIMRLVNFAHGEFIMLGAFALVLIAPYSAPLALLAAVVVPVVGALLVERIAFRPIRGADHSTMLVTSFALSFLLQNLAIFFLGSVTRTVDILPELGRSVRVGSLSLSLATLVTTALSVGLLLAIAVFMRRTRMGVQMRAAATDLEMARLLGVRGNRVIGVAFALSGLLAGTAAIAVVSQAGTVEASIGVNLVLVAFTAAVVGGMDSLAGATVGAYVVGTASVLAETLLPPDLRGYRDAVTFGLVIVVLVFRPQGLFATKGRV